jgi:hypothetical protein
MSCFMRCCGFRERKRSHNHVSYAALGAISSTSSAGATSNDNTEKMHIVPRVDALELNLRCYICCFGACEEDGIAESTIYRKWASVNELWRWREVPPLIFGSICECDPRKGSSVHIFCLQKMFEKLSVEQQQTCTYCRKPWFIQSCLRTDTFAKNSIKPYSSDDNMVVSITPQWQRVSKIPSETRDPKHPTTRFTPITVNDRYRIHIEAGKGCACKPREARNDELPVSYTHIQVRIEDRRQSLCEPFFISPFCEPRLKGAVWCRHFNRDPTIGRKIPWSTIANIEASLIKASE